MTKNARTHLMAALAGDVGRIQQLKLIENAELVSAAADLPRPALGADALVRVLDALEAGAYAESDIQEWASFVRWGHLPRGGDGPYRPVDITYDPAREDAIVEVVARLDELGDIIDGQISAPELKELRDSMG